MNVPHGAGQTLRLWPYSRARPCARRRGWLLPGYAECSAPLPLSPSPRAVPQAGRASPRAWCSALSVCPCRAAVPFSCPLLGTSPCSHLLAAPSPPPAAAGEDGQSLWPLVRAFGSASHGLCSRGVGLGSAAQMKPVSWHGHGKALGSFPVQNNARGVCRLQSFLRSVVPGCWTWRLPAVGAA